MIEIMQRTWIRITVDGVVADERMVNEGEILNYTAQQSIGVRANNAAGLKLTVNNQPQGILGGRGELFDQTFTLEGAGGPTGLAIPSGDPVLDLPLTATAAALFASPAASPSQAALFFTPTSTLPLDPGDGSMLSEGTRHSNPPRRAQTRPPDAPDGCPDTNVRTNSAAIRHTRTVRTAERDADHRTDAHTRAERDTDSDAFAHRPAHRHASPSYPNEYAHRCRDTLPYAHAHRYGHSDRNGHAHADPDPVTDAVLVAYPIADADAHTVPAAALHAHAVTRAEVAPAGDRLLSLAYLAKLTV
jgi:hypothetical protein